MDLSLERKIKRTLLVNPINPNLNKVNHLIMMMKRNPLRKLLKIAQIKLQRLNLNCAMMNFRLLIQIKKYVLRQSKEVK